METDEELSHAISTLFVWPMDVCHFTTHGGAVLTEVKEDFSIKPTVYLLNSKKPTLDELVTAVLEVKNTQYYLQHLAKDSHEDCRS